MTTTQTTAHPLAVAGRRVTFTYHRDRDQADPPAYPGIITGTEPGYSGALRALIRLDGRRSTLSIPVTYEGLRYLDEVVPVPDLPMGRFYPVPDDRNAIYERAGVPVAAIGEDGDNLVIVTDDPAMAQAAALAYADEMGIDLSDLCLDETDLVWAAFEWEPEDAECPWTMSLVQEGDDHAVPIFYLPA